ncbi:uncharacterized protein LOC144477775, partial [Augochlora pura]
MATCNNGSNGEETIQIEKLKDESNFQIWKFQITIVLKSMSVHNIIIGKDLPGDDWTDKMEKDWELKDAKAQRLIITSIERKPLMHLLNCLTSREMFNKLSKIYGKDTEQNKYSLLQEFYNYTYGKGGDITVHVSTLENLAYRLNALNQPIDDLMLITKILATLPRQYSHFASAWDSTPAQEKTLPNKKHCQ